MTPQPSQKLDDTDADSEPETDDDENQNVSKVQRNSHKSRETKSLEKKNNHPKTDKSNISANSSEKVCTYFRKGQCRYGIGGKGCPRAHPTLCRRLMAHGTHSTRGYTKGSSCPRFHPKMCPSSVSHKECLNDSCSLYHVKGTRRMNSRQQSNSRRDDHNQDQKKYDHTGPIQNTKAPKQDKDDFLEMLNLWKKDIVSAILTDLKSQGVYRMNIPAQQHPSAGQLIPGMTQYPPRGYSQILY